MNFSKFKALLLTLLFTSGCTIAPLTEEHTASTLGTNNNEWSYNIGAPFHTSVAYKRGVNQKLDLGGLMELQPTGALLGLTGKYLLTSIDNKNPFALSFGAGIGSSTSYLYLGPIKSFKISPSYELSLNIRLNTFKWDISGVDEKDDATDYIEEILNSSISAVNDTYFYTSLNISNTYWFNKKFGATLSLTGMAFLEPISGSSFFSGVKLHYKY